MTFVISLTTTVAAFEFDLFLYILNLQPSGRELLAVDAIKVAPYWAIMAVYGLIFLVYVRKFTRSKTTALSFITINIILFALLMLEVLLALFGRIYLPVVLPGMVMILVSTIYLLVNLYRHLSASLLLQHKEVSLEDIQKDRFW